MLAENLQAFSPLFWAFVTVECIVPIFIFIKLFLTERTCPVARFKSVKDVLSGEATCATIEPKFFHFLPC